MKFAPRVRYIRATVISAVLAAFIPSMAEFFTEPLARTRDSRSSDASCS